MDDEIELEKPESNGWRLLFSKFVVYGTLISVTLAAGYILSKADISYTAEIALSTPLQILVWFVMLYVILIMVASYVRVFGVSFVNSLANTVLDMLDSYERR